MYELKTGDCKLETNCKISENWKLIVSHEYNFKEN